MQFDLRLRMFKVNESQLCAYNNVMSRDTLEYSNDRMIEIIVDRCKTRAHALRDRNRLIIN